MDRSGAKDRVAGGVLLEERVKKSPFSYSARQVLDVWRPEFPPELFYRSQHIEVRPAPFELACRVFRKPQPKAALTTLGWRISVSRAGFFGQLGVWRAGILTHGI